MTDPSSHASDTLETQFVEVLLPVPVPKLFTYRVPQPLTGRVVIGQRVIVQFGDRKILTGVVANVTNKPPAGYEAKLILDLLDDYASITEQQFQLFRWIASYYLCSLGEVLNAALPSGLKLSSESMVQRHPSFDPEESDWPMSEKELTLLRQLGDQSMSYSEIADLLGIKNIYAILKSLVAKDAIILYEEVKEKYKPKKEKRVRLTATYNTAAKLEELFETLAARPKQEEIVLRYLQEVPVLQQPERNKSGILKKRLLEDDLSESALNTLVKHNVFDVFEVIVSRFEGEEESLSSTAAQLSPDQQQTRFDLLTSFNEHHCTLLYGITGSGKTEIYINLITQALEGGSQVLYMLPEIALTTQIVQRLRKIFGSTMGVYHSRFSDSERVEVWNGILQGKLKFIVGVRSAVFLPFDNLGLIIVDEEHDASYKQQEPAPRYHARDVALVLGQTHHAKVLLGSATPSVETYYQCQTGKYGMVRLDKRFGEAQLPDVVLADLSRERKQKTSKGEFSGTLLRAIEEALSQKEQVIIFQNRRGYSPTINCEDCDWVPKCVNCAVSLTYHQYKNALVCHYCGYREAFPHQCPTCTSTRLITVGYGTEKLEEELKLYFPNAVVQRMDLDTTRSKSGYETIIDRFQNGETNILVGTQMVTKGLDFDHVSLVGIFNADRMIHFPDFRSYERAFQLITQVSGRAGRRNKAGKVVIQTANPEHPLLHTILTHKSEAFYHEQLTDRQAHGYPPYSRLLEIIVKHIDKKTCRAAADRLHAALRQALPDVRILGPGEPMISKIRNQYLLTVLLKIPRNSPRLAAIKAAVLVNVAEINEIKDFRSVRIILDADPV
jgi:primosomal protein N' (replication factor Y)